VRRRRRCCCCCWCACLLCVHAVAAVARMPCRSTDFV
jgi:hypothetical protein